LTGDRSLADYFEAAVEASGGNARGTANWIRSELLRELENAGLAAEKSPIPASELGALVRLIDEDKISGKQGKDVLVEMFATGKAAAAIVEEKGLVQVSDTGEIDRVIDEVMATNPNQLEQYRSGKETLFGFFVGQVMKASKGKANPKIVNERSAEN
jgi:aspartyl-tRNA(Asn)/glutamyl-tRNA(Gln) amidotransferase subunit B